MIVEEFYDKHSHIMHLQSVVAAKSEYDDDRQLQQQNQSTREQISNIPDFSED